MTAACLVTLSASDSDQGVKFIPPETLARFGGAEAFARAVDEALTKLGGLLSESDQIRRLLLGDAV